MPTRPRRARGAATLVKPVHVRVDPSNLPPSAIDDLRQIAQEHPGPAEVVLELDSPARRPPAAPR